MSQHAPASANTATLILLRLGLTITGLFATVFLLLTQTHGQSFGKALVYAAITAGFALLFRGLRDLSRELNRQSPQHPLPPPARSR